MLKKLVRPLTAIFLLALAICWIIFLESKRDKVTDTETPTPTLIAENATPTAAEPSLAPSATPKPTIAPAATATPTPIPTPTDIPEPTIIFEYCTTKTSDDLDIYNGPSTSYSICGTMKGFSIATILERGDDWIKVKTPEITGYIEKNLLDLDDNAVKTLREIGMLQIKITGNDVNIRSEANTTCDVVGKGNINTYYDYLPEYDTGDFYAILYDNKTAFVSKKYSKFETTN